MSKKIYLKAYFRRNAGDDMFIDHILRRYPTVDFCAYARSVDLPMLQTTHNLRLVPTWKLFADRVVRKVCKKKPLTNRYERQADATVHIGGSIFIEPKAFRTPVRFYYPDNMFYIGCNFGPCRTPAYFEFIRGRLERATDVCFRDTASYAAFSDLDTVRQAPDVLFGYSAYPARQKGEGIGISVIDVTSRADIKDEADVYYSSIAAVIDRCAKEHIPVKLLSFCTEEGDMKAVSEILKRSESKCADVCEYVGDIGTFLDQINSCEYLIATRFHAMIIGWVLGKKVYPVIYSDKQTNVIEDLRFTGAYWDVRNKDDSGDRLYANCVAAPCLDHVQQHIQAAENQFAALDRFLSVT